MPAGAQVINKIKRVDRLLDNQQLQKHVLALFSNIIVMLTHPVITVHHCGGLKRLSDSVFSRTPGQSYLRWTFSTASESGGYVRYAAKFLRSGCISQG